MLRGMVQTFSANKTLSSVWRGLEADVFADFLASAPTGDGVYVVDCGLSIAQLCSHDRVDNIPPLPPENVH